MTRLCSAAKLISIGFCRSSDGLSLCQSLSQLRSFGSVLLLSGGFISDSREASETSRFAYQETSAAAVNVRADLSDRQQDEADMPAQKRMSLHLEVLSMEFQSGKRLITIFLGLLATCSAYGIPGTKRNFW
jgi:hypothetical protein